VLLNEELAYVPHFYSWIPLPKQPWVCLQADHCETCNCINNSRSYLHPNMAPHLFGFVQIDHHFYCWISLPKQPWICTQAGHCGVCISSLNSWSYLHAAGLELELMLREKHSFQIDEPTICGVTFAYMVASPHDGHAAVGQHY